MYMWHEGGSFLFIGTHVDDLFVLYNQDGRKIRDRVLEKIKETMEVAEKGEISFALDMKIERDREKGFLKISQTQYTENFLKEYGMLDGDTKETPYPLTDITEEDLPQTEEERKEVERLPVREVIGKLWWLALQSRPDIFCALHKCSLCKTIPVRDYGSI